MDLLSRLPRAPPGHISPIELGEPSICAKESLDERQDVTLVKKMAAFSFVAWSIKNCLEEPKEVMINVRSRNKRSTEVLKDSTPNKHIKNTVHEESEELNTLTMIAEYWGAVNIPQMIHLAMSEDTKVQWKKAYLDDPLFKSIAKADDYHISIWQTGTREMIFCG